MGDQVTFDRRDNRRSERARTNKNRLLAFGDARATPSPAPELVDLGRERRAGVAGRSFGSPPTGSNPPGHRGSGVEDPHDAFDRRKRGGPAPMRERMRSRACRTARFGGPAVEAERRLTATRRARPARRLRRCQGLGLLQLFKCATRRDPTGSLSHRSRNPSGASSGYGAFCRPGEISVSICRDESDSASPR